jgi:two-component system, NarL family, response regulator DegU
MESPSLETSPAVAPVQMDHTPLRLFIADESIMGCELLRNTFRHFRQQFEVVACGVTSAAIVRFCSANHVDVALISADLGDGHLMGLKAMRELRVSRSATRVVILFDSWQNDLIVDAFRAGAKGVLCRAEPVEHLRKCLLSVCKGQIWANSTQLQLILEALANAAPIRIVNARGLSLLTKRETQLAELIAEGTPTKEITEKLGISEHTVSNYLFRIYNKIGVSNRLELALCTIKQREDGTLKTECGAT